MRRTQILRGTGINILFLLAMCIGLFSSCYNDDDLKNSISGLEDRVGKLEASLKNIQSDISALQTLTDALSKNKTITSVVPNEDGSQTIKFSDKTEVIIRNGQDAPQITIIKDETDQIYYWGIAKADGTKTFLKDGDGKNMPVTASAPKVRINTDTKEWEISTDNGKTWQSTGVIASGDTSASLFTKVDSDNDFVYFTLQDGTVLKVVQSKVLECKILAGKLYFTNAEVKKIEVEMSGISKFTLTKPDGWKVSLSGTGLSITAPATENQYAETSGKVAVVAVALNGQSIISEIPVTIGTAPVTIAVENRLISTTLATGVSTYYLGAIKTSEYTPEKVASLMNESSRLYVKTAPMSKVSLADVLGSAPLGTESYIIWTMVAPKSGTVYMADEVMANAVQPLPSVELKVSDITFEGAIISAIRKGCQEYVGGIITKADFTPEGVITDLGFNTGTKHLSDYNGPLVGTDYDYCPSIVPGTTYVVWAIPFSADKDNYKVEDLKYVEAAFPALTYDGTAKVTVDNVTSTLSSFTATLNPGTDCYKYYYSYMTEAVMAKYTTEKEAIGYLIKSGKAAKAMYKFSKTGMKPDTKGFLIAVALDSKGQLGSLVKVQADSKAITYNNAISVDITADPKFTSTTFTLTPKGSVVKYRYIHVKKSEFGNSPYFGDEAIVKQNLALNTNVTEVNPSDLTNNIVEISNILFSTDYILYMIAVDADGNPSDVVTKIEYKTPRPTFVREATDPTNWNANIPEIKVDKIDFGGKLYTVTYTVTPKESNSVFYSFTGPASYLNGMFDEQIQYVMKNGTKQTTAYTGTFVGYLPTSINVTCIDKDGRFYELSKYTVEKPAE